MGMESTVAPILVLASGIYFSHHFAGLYGVAIAAAGMLFRVEFPRKDKNEPKPVLPDDRIPYFEMALA